MTIKEMLNNYLEQERNNVFCYSANYLMDTPKKGYEQEFTEAVERVSLLEELLRTM